MGSGGGRREGGEEEEGKGMRRGQGGWEGEVEGR